MGQALLCALCGITPFSAGNKTEHAAHTTELALHVLSWKALVLLLITGHKCRAERGGPVP